LAALAALGALAVGLIALHSWLALQVGSLAALGMIGAGLLLLMLILLLVAFTLRRPWLKTRLPAAQVGARTGLPPDQGTLGIHRRPYRCPLRVRVA
jgi:hypothetical protein